MERAPAPAGPSCLPQGLGAFGDRPCYQAGEARGRRGADDLPLPSFNWQAYRGYIFDLDGTVYLGDRLIPGADRVVAKLRASGRGVVFLSNKPLESRESYAAKLTRLGIPTEPDDVIHSSAVLARGLATRYPGATAFVLGEPPLIDELRRAGVPVVEDPSAVGWHVDFVVAAFDRTLTWAKLNDAHQALRRGARLIATNPDRTCPVDGGDVPDAGAIIAALEASSGCRLEWVAGKPSPLVVEAALARLGTRPDETVMVGDRLETDMAMARQAGLRAVLVLTGVTKPDAVLSAPAAWRPDWVLESIQRLVDPDDAALAGVAPAGR